MRVLLTCPPMIGLVDEFRADFEARGIELVVPDFVQVMSEEALMDILPSCDGWIIGDDPATAQVLEAGNDGKLVAAVKWGLGVDNVDFDAARARGMSIVNTPTVFGNEVADVAMAYVIGLARETYLIDREVRAGGWPKPAGISLEDKVAGVVGFGDIGRQVSRRLAVSGMTQIIYDPAYADAEAQANLPVATWPERLDELDFLVFVCALTASNRHMLSADEIARLKPGVRIVTVARGPLIDEAASIDGLETGAVHSAALDVMEIEPLPAGSKLRDYPHCIFGSHTASNTKDAVRRTSQLAMTSLFEFLGIDDA